MLCQKCKKREGKTKNARYCNACYVSIYREKNGISRYGGNREKILIRNKYTCQICGKNKDNARIQIHHIDGNGSSKNGKLLKISEQNNTLENLLVVCDRCHCLIEKEKRAIKIGLLLTNKLVCV